jgi:hypothetical protein
LLQVGTALVTPTDGKLYVPIDGAVTVPIDCPELPNVLGCVVAGSPAPPDGVVAITRV